MFHMINIIQYIKDMQHCWTSACRYKAHLWLYLVAPFWMPENFVELTDHNADWCRGSQKRANNAWQHPNAVFWLASEGCGMENYYMGVRRKYIWWACRIQNNGKDGFGASFRLENGSNKFTYFLADFNFVFTRITIDRLELMWPTYGIIVLLFHSRTID